MLSYNGVRGKIKRIHMEEMEQEYIEEKKLL
jgi:hypothetical protein